MTRFWGFSRLALEFAKHCEQVIVICLSKGEYDLPKNVKILSLGKKTSHFPLSTFNFSKIKYALNFGSIFGANETIMTQYLYT